VFIVFILLSSLLDTDHFLALLCKVAVEFVSQSSGWQMPRPSIDKKMKKGKYRPRLRSGLFKSEVTTSTNKSLQKKAVVKLK
jgi:hypothetical protein